MTAYFIRRFLLIIPTFIGITVMVFAITRFVPGGPIERIINRAVFESSARGLGYTDQPLSEDQLEQLKEYYGFNKPIIISYLSWLKKVFKGDLGVSTRYYDPVLDMILERVPISLYFGLTSLIIVYAVCIPLGIAKAVKHKGAFDNISSLIIFIGYAIPGWVAGGLLLIIFKDTFPLGELVSFGFEDMTIIEKIFDILWHTALPLASYVIGSFAVTALLVKNTLMDNLSADYVRTAVAKGLSFKKAVFKHALRNSLIPVATSFGNNISVVISGSFLIEKIFNINGMGLLGYESIVQRDYPAVMGILAVSSLLFMIGNILSDITVAIVDPRVKFEP